MYTLFKYLGSLLFILLLSACATSYVAPTTGETATLIITSRVEHKYVEFEIRDRQNFDDRKSLGKVLYADEFPNYHKMIAGLTGSKITDRIEVKIPAGRDFYLYGGYEVETYQYNGSSSTKYTRKFSASKLIENVKSGAIYHAIFVDPDSDRDPTLFRAPDPDKDPKFILNQSVD